MNQLFAKAWHIITTHHKQNDVQNTGSDTPK